MTTDDRVMILVAAYCALVLAARAGVVWLWGI
jgi:hypothetical protein